MDQTQLQQNIVKYYGKLPNDLQQSFSSMTWMEDLKNISIKYSLNEEQTETLATETTLVLLSIIHLEDYVLTLKKDLKLDEEKFNKILDDLDVTILKDIKDDLVNTFELNVEFLNDENNKEAEISNKEQVVSSKGEEVITNDKLRITKEKEEDEVPLPPYVISSKEQVVSSKGDQSSMEKVVSSKEEEIPKENLVVVNKPDEELKYIPKNVFEDKMKGATTSENATSDHSPKAPDPYRETF